MSCERIRFRLSLLQDESGPYETPRWVWDHVSRCGACRSFQVVTLGLAEEYRLEVRSRVQALNRLEGDGSREFPFPRRRRTGVLTLAAALPALLIAILLILDRSPETSVPPPAAARALPKIPAGPSAPSRSARPLPALASVPAARPNRRPLPNFLRSERSEIREIAMPPALREGDPDPMPEPASPWTDVLFETAREAASRASQPFEWRADPRPLLALGGIE